MKHGPVKHWPICSLLAAAGFASLSAAESMIEPVPSREPSQHQKNQIARRYGMFIHFGINTFHNKEWTDGSLPASSYSPAAIDAKQWVKTAKDAGMKYIILVAKHHDGFCLWDSKCTEYDVANSGNATNVIEEVARECKEQGIGLGLYYSLWDRKENADTENEALDEAYENYMIRQLNELIDITGKHIKIVEFWFDGAWVKPSFRWPLARIYDTVKSREPQCQIGINHTIGRLDRPGIPIKELQTYKISPEKQKEGDPIRYFPSDFRLWDPRLPGDHDPKLFSHDGKLYYLPWESTVCMSDCWFFNTEDKKWKSVDELADLYKRATAQDNILILNAPPNREGRLREQDVKLLRDLRLKLGL